MRADSTPVAQFPFPVLSTDPGLIHLADYCRVFVLILGVMFCAICIRAVWKDQIPSAARTGFRWRLAAMSLGVLYVCGTEYQRIGDAITARLPLGVVFLVVAAYSVLIAIPSTRDPVLRLEKALAFEDEPPVDSRLDGRS